MPTPDPSLMPAAVTSVSTLFTANWTTFVTATIALIGIITLPSIVMRGGLGKAVHALRSVFRGGRA